MGPMSLYALQKLIRDVNRKPVCACGRGLTAREP
jgi:hypothetical protein